MSPSSPQSPAGLGPRGRALWRSIHAAAVAGSSAEQVLEFDEREREVLRLACSQVDDLAALEAAIRRDGVTSVGSQGQPRLSALVVEARQARLALARLLGEIELPDVEETPRSQASLRAQRAAQARWRAQAERKAARRAS